MQYQILGHHSRMLLLDPSIVKIFLEHNADVLLKFFVAQQGFSIFGPLGMALHKSSCHV